MKIADILIKMNVDSVLRAIKRNIKAHFIIHKKDYENLLELYSEEEIFEAIDSIFCQDKSIIAPMRGKSGKILRYLEYGGERVKQGKLLSKVSRNLMRKVSVDYVI